MVHALYDQFLCSFLPFLALLSAMNSYADMVKFGQTKVQVAIPAKTAVPKKTMKKTVSKLQVNNIPVPEYRTLLEQITLELLSLTYSYSEHHRLLL